jgi:hypothetical protein
MVPGLPTGAVVGKAVAMDAAANWIYWRNLY